MLCAIVSASCSNLANEDINNLQEITINAYTDNSKTSNTKTAIVQNEEVYNVNWKENDNIAIFSDEANNPSKFSLISGADTNSGVFIGHTNPSEYYTAVYPFEMVNGVKNQSKIGIFINDKQSFVKNGISTNTLPMFAYGKSNALNFYNLSGVVQLQLTGSTILKSVTFTSNDNSVISGEAILDLSDTSSPIVNLSETGGRKIILECDGIALAPDEIENLFIVVPYRTYQEGIKLTIDTYTGTHNIVIESPITLERSQIRKVKPIAIKEEHPKPSQRSDKQLWYKTTNGEKCPIANKTAFNANIISHTYLNGWGIISFDTPPTKINDKVFAKPSLISELHLPHKVQHIGNYAFSMISIDEIDLPTSLISLGLDAFSYCKNIKNIIIPEGVKNIDDEAFAECHSLEYVTFPNSLKNTCPYIFRHSDNLIKFYGNTDFISSDGRCFFTNTAYGMTTDLMLDKVAGKGLETYTIPDYCNNIQNYALSGCTDLTTLTLHSNIKTCGTDPFPLNGNLKVIYVNAIEPPSITFWTPLNGIEAVYVPKESVSLYQNCEGWRDLKDIIKAANP